MVRHPPGGSSHFTYYICADCEVDYSRITTWNGKTRTIPAFSSRTQQNQEQPEKTSTLSVTSAIYGVGGPRNVPAVLPLGRNRCSLYRRLGGAQDRSGRVRKISPPREFDPRNVQAVASRYND
jgi:hypothetical protein